MRKFLISVAWFRPPLTAVPAAAQPRPLCPAQLAAARAGRPAAQVNELLRDLTRPRTASHRSQQRRIISPREAVSLRREAQQIRFRLNLAARNGIDGREFADLRVRSTGSSSASASSAATATAAAAKRHDMGAPLD